MDHSDFLQQKWLHLTFKDNFIFSKTLELFPHLCKKILELILQLNIKSIDFPEREKVIESRTDSKGIRLDVYVHDDLNRSFDIEMQIADSDNISKRMRYYQGLIDGDKLKHGQHYGSLGDSYIIFICPFDKFKRGRHIYTFRERCDEDSTLTLNDGSVKIFLSTKGCINDISFELKNFLNYVDSGIITGNFLQKLDAAVNSVKSNEKARLDFMTYQMALLESKLEGEEKGREEERIQMIKNLINVKTPIEYIIKATGWSEEKILQVLKISDNNSRSKNQILL